ncbi:hypothetical protein BDY24DRAFT_413983 [Mrakia frigida]|uniref:uncharacterized protein n=1 Tax=Mrakia frigida TaxID=29902 RepID=UPI003FCC269E
MSLSSFTRANSVESKRHSNAFDLARTRSISEIRTLSANNYHDGCLERARMASRGRSDVDGIREAARMQASLTLRVQKGISRSNVPNHLPNFKFKITTQTLLPAFNIHSSRSWVPDRVSMLERVYLSWDEKWSRKLFRTEELGRRGLKRYPDW